MFRSGPTIGDVLAAKDGIEGKAWTFKTTNRNIPKLVNGNFFIMLSKELHQRTSHSYMKLE